MVASHSAAHGKHSPRYADSRQLPSLKPRRKVLYIKERKPWPLPAGVVVFFKSRPHPHPHTHTQRDADLIIFIGRTVSVPKLAPYAGDPAVLVAAIIEAHVTHWVTVAAAEATYAITTTTSDIITTITHQMVTTYSGVITVTSSEFPSYICSATVASGQRCCNISTCTQHQTLIPLRRSKRRRVMVAKAIVS
jgi:hypothetical protein